MSYPLALLDFKSISEKQIHRLFDSAEDFEKNFFLKKKEKKFDFSIAALLFFEPSTRTRMSFEMACGRLGLDRVLLDGASGSSLEKGESFEDTVLNVAAMAPALLIVRAPDHFPMDKISSQLKIPWVNAGWGKKSHPTQALLDALTIKKFRGKNFHEQNVLFVGDISHSRVFGSHRELSGILGYSIGVCGPEEFLKGFTLGSDVRIFSSLKEALSWATVVVALRVQRERHSESHDLAQYHRQWGLNRESLLSLSPEALILHPGPVQHGVELDSEIFQDPRCRIFNQVSGGVILRQALLDQMLQRNF